MDITNPPKPFNFSRSLIVNKLVSDIGRVAIPLFIGAYSGGYLLLGYGAILVVVLVFWDVTREKRINLERVEQSQVVIDYWQYQYKQRAFRAEQLTYVSTMRHKKLKKKYPGGAVSAPAFIDDWVQNEASLKSILIPMRNDLKSVIMSVVNRHDSTLRANNENLANDVTKVTARISIMEVSQDGTEALIIASSEHTPEIRVGHKFLLNNGQNYLISQVLIAGSSKAISDTTAYTANCLANDLDCSFEFQNANERKYLRSIFIIPIEGESGRRLFLSLDTNARGFFKNNQHARLEIDSRFYEETAEPLLAAYMPMIEYQNELAGINFIYGSTE